MPSITNKVRDELQDLMREEVGMVQAKAAKEADSQWQEAEKAVAQSLGYDDVLVRIEHIQNQIEGLQKELTELESTVHEKARPASVEDYRDAGLDVMSDRYGRIYGRPEVFGRQLNTRWDTLVLKHLNEQVPFFKVHYNLSQLHHTVRRELLLCGNYEEARALYQRFHEKIGLAIGQDLPGLLAEVESIPALQKPESD